MRTIKVIDLLNKISRNYAPKKIKYKGIEYEYDKELNYYDGLGNLGDELAPIISILHDEIDIL